MTQLHPCSHLHGHQSQAALLFELQLVDQALDHGVLCCRLLHSADAGAIFSLYLRKCSLSWSTYARACSWYSSLHTFKKTWSSFCGSFDRPTRPSNTESTWSESTDAKCKLIASSSVGSSTTTRWPSTRSSTRSKSKGSILSTDTWSKAESTTFATSRSATSQRRTDSIVITTWSFGATWSPSRSLSSSSTFSSWPGPLPYKIQPEVGLQSLRARHVVLGLSHDPVVCAQLLQHHAVLEVRTSADHDGCNQNRLRRHELSAQTDQLQSRAVRRLRDFSAGVCGSFQFPVHGAVFLAVLADESPANIDPLLQLAGHRLCAVWHRAPAK